jgi:S1-C subfamily serine protease
VVTNAHVVAGEADTTVQLRGVGAHLPAVPVDFDPHDDVAVLKVDSLTAPALSVAPRARSGSSAAILGFPLDGTFDAEPARIGDTDTFSTEDAYGNGPVTRSITSLRGLVRPGNSGGPLVNAAGQVVATVFASITGTARPGGFAVPNAVVESQLAAARARRGRPVSTQACSR